MCMAKTKANKSTKTLRLSRQAKAPKQTKPDVVSFRLTAAQTKMLQNTFDRVPIAGVDSPNRLARKVTCDFLAGRIKYIDPTHMLQDVDMIGA